MSAPHPAQPSSAVRGTWALRGAGALLALALLAMALRWRVPMMLWDHLDLVPMLEAARAGTLGRSIFWRLGQQRRCRGPRRNMAPTSR